MPNSADLQPHPCGIIGMGLMGTAVQQMTRASRGWDLDETRCACEATAQEVFDNCEVVFLCLPNSDIAASKLRAVI